MLHGHDQQVVGIDSTLTQETQRMNIGKGTRVGIFEWHS